MDNTAYESTARPRGYSGEPGNDGQAVPASLEPIHFRHLLALKPQLLPPVIDGVLREAAVATVIGASKTKKTWLMISLAAATLTGGEWLGHKVTQGRVLIIDGELSQPTLFHRIKDVFAALGVSDDEAADGLDIHVMRGRTRDFPAALAAALAKTQGYYRLIIVDPLSCFYPDDPTFSENSNAQMRRVYDSIITMASKTHSAVVVVHHYSKGGQAEKSVIDVGSGAGAIARSGDAHLVLRAHKEPGGVVCEMVVREFAENLATCWQWSFPVFVPAPDLNPLELAGMKTRKEKTPKAVKPEPMMVAEFVAKFLSKEPRELAYIQAKARPISPRAAAQNVKEAVATGLAFKWECGSKNPAKYATIAQPELLKGVKDAGVCVRAHTPPHPPGGAKARRGVGKKRAHTQADASMRTPNAPTERGVA